MLLDGQGSGAPWRRSEEYRKKLTQETEDEVQLLLDSGAWEEGLAGGHLIEDAAHAPAEARATVRRKAQARLLRLAGVLSSPLLYSLCPTTLLTPLPMP